MLAALNWNAPYILHLALGLAARRLPECLPDAARQLSLFVSSIRVLAGHARTVRQALFSARRTPLTQRPCQRREKSQNRPHATHRHESAMRSIATSPQTARTHVAKSDVRGSGESAGCLKMGHLKHPGLRIQDSVRALAASCCVGCRCDRVACSAAHGSRRCDSAAPQPALHHARIA